MTSPLKYVPGCCVEDCRLKYILIPNETLIVMTIVEERIAAITIQMSGISLVWSCVSDPLCVWLLSFVVAGVVTCW